MAKYAAYEPVIGAVTIKQIVSSGYESNSNAARFAAAGATADSFIAGDRAEPKASFVSTDIDGVIDGINTAGSLYLNVAAGSIKIPWNKRLEGGVFEGTLKHLEVSAANGMSIVNEISARQDDTAAQATVETAFKSTDGLTDPMTETDLVTLASSSFNVIHALALVQVNGTTVPEIMGVTVRPGIVLINDRANGGIYPDTQSLSNPFRPVIEVTMRSLDFVATHDSIFAALTSIDCYFRKRSSTGFVAKTTAEHVKLSLGASGLIKPTSMSGNENNNAELTVGFEGLTLTASTVATIP